MVRQSLLHVASVAAPSCATMDAFAERIKQYSAKEQAELRVRVMLPGNMFPGWV